MTITLLVLGYAAVLFFVWSLVAINPRDDE